MKASLPRKKQTVTAEQPKYLFSWYTTRHDIAQVGGLQNQIKEVKVKKLKNENEDNEENLLKNKKIVVKVS